MTALLENLNIISVVLGLLIWAFTLGVGWTKMKAMISEVAASMGGAIKSNTQTIIEMKEVWERDREERDKERESDRKWIITLEKMLIDHDGDIKVLNDRTKEA